jgi:very-short-patch-repair endonuclease
VGLADARSSHDKRRSISPKAAHTYLEGEARFLETAFVNKRRYLQERRTQFANAAANLCGSPIEQMLLARLFWLNYDHAWVEIWDAAKQFTKPDGGVVIVPQHYIGKHRVDFAILLTGLAPIRIVVECDGHEFHEKTKEQAARDKMRDRDLQIAGWKVLRFTGSEICRNDAECGAQIETLVVNEIDAQRRLTSQLAAPS